jgi:hypothetical protein
VESFRLIGKLLFKQGIPSHVADAPSFVEVKMNSVRKISKVWKSKPNIEGAGVHLKRAFGYWNGPIVMNTQEELRMAFEEFEKGAFIKHK